MNLKFLVVPILALAGGTGMLSAQNFQPPGGVQIGWASNAYAPNYLADGITTFEAAQATIHFELGVFTGGFVPTADNITEWDQYWVSMDVAVYNVSEQQVISTTTLSSNAGAFMQGTQAWIWGYTSKALAGNPEYLLAGSAQWKVPSASSNLPVTWSLGDLLATEAVVGGANPANGAFHLKLASVPEPSSSALVLIFTAGMAFRRKRRVPVQVAVA